MNESETPFDSIEGSYQYVDMLAEAIAEARRDVEAEVALAEEEDHPVDDDGIKIDNVATRRAGGHPR